LEDHPDVLVGPGTADDAGVVRAREVATMGMIPGGSLANRKFCERAITVSDGVDALLVDLLADAQTSGGLLISVAGDRAERLHEALERRGVPHPEIGKVIGKSPGHVHLLP
jgi:selenide,water dikinase